MCRQYVYGSLRIQRGLIRLKRTWVRNQQCIDNVYSLLGSFSPMSLFSLSAKGGPEMNRGGGFILA